MSERSAISQQQSPAMAMMLQADRPTALLERPETIDVMSVTPEGPPQWLRWRGGEYAVIASSGPERIAEEWWRSAEFDCRARDYFRVQINDGRWLWVFRVRGGNEDAGAGWFVHGEWT
jgi:protein ImuB